MSLRSLILASVLVLFFSASFSQAQERRDFAVAQELTINEKQVRDGDIISSLPQGFVLTRKTYDQAMIGVVSERPAVAFRTIGVSPAQKKYLVVSSGTTGVNVSTINGPIKKGDILTSSTIPGVGMRSSKSGFIVGTALDDYKDNNIYNVKKINVLLSFRPVGVPGSVRSNLVDVGNLSLLAILEDPLTAFRYLVAAVVIIFSFLLGFYSFGRVAGRGVEALGRNPLAARVIQLGIALNVIITVAIIGTGIVIAILILTI